MSNKKNMFHYKVIECVEDFDNKIEDNIYFLKNEINYLYKTRKYSLLPEHKTLGEVKYFSKNGTGVFLDNVNPTPKIYSFYNLESIKQILNNEFNDSLLAILYTEIQKTSEDHEEIIYITPYDEKWAKVFQNKTLSKSFIKYKKSIAKNNTEFIMYDYYNDYLNNQGMFTIIIPEYDINEYNQLIKGIWYFDFNKTFFEPSLNKIKKELGVNAAVTDSKGNLILSTSRKFPNGKFFQYPVGKTNYKLLIQEVSLLDIIGIEDIGFIVFSLLLLFYTTKRENLKSQIQMLKINEKIRTYLLLRDPLTRLYNRYYLENYLDFNNPKDGVILFDVDNFKQINDRFGHQKGDQVLKSISHALKLISNNNFKSLRWGGEEFLIIFRNISQEEVLSKVTLLQNLIKDLSILSDHEKITASFGVVYQKIENKDELFKAIDEADKKLYTGKSTGKDKIIF